MFTLQTTDVWEELSRELDNLSHEDKVEWASNPYTKWLKKYLQSDMEHAFALWYSDADAPEHLRGHARALNAIKMLIDEIIQSEKELET